MTSFQSLTYEKTESIGQIQLNRPKVHNAFNTVMRDELYEVLGATGDDSEIRVVILSGLGADFCSGADLTEFGTAPSIIEARSIRWERDVWDLFINLNKPLIAIIQGHCLGSGMEMAMLCDFRIVSDEAVFGMPENRLGLIPAAGGTQTLPRNTNLSESLMMLLSGRYMDARTALTLGIATKVVPKRELNKEAYKIAKLLSELCPAVVTMTKDVVRRGMDLTLDQGLELETVLARQRIQLTSRYTADNI